MLWTLVEYLFHRFLLHNEFNNRFIIDLQYYFHGIHHKYPNATLFLPSLYYLIILILSLTILKMMVAIGFYMGFLFYEVFHYYLHHKNYRNRLFKYLKAHHFYHHFKDKNKNYAVTLPLWDYIFLTKN